MSEEEFRQILEKNLLEIADAMMAYYDPCHIVGHSCKASENNPCCFHTVYGPSLCEFMYDDACHHPNAMCRLWICKTAIASTEPKCVEGLQLLEKFGYLFGVIRRPMIGQPYSGADRQPIEQ